MIADERKNFCKSNGQISRCECQGVLPEGFKCAKGDEEFFVPKKGKPDYCWWYDPTIPRCANCKAQIAGTKK